MRYTNYITRNILLTHEMVNEYALNGASDRFHALNDAFCHPDRVLLIEGGHCQSVRKDINWACPNDTDEGQPYCDDCMEAIQFETASSVSEEDDWREPHQLYMAAAWPRT